MTRTLAALAKRFRFNEQLLRVSTAGFEPEDWTRPPGAQGGNTAHWILGHVTQARRMIVRRLGESLAHEPWEKKVGMNSKPDGTLDIPSAAALAEEFRACGETLEGLMGALGDAEAELDWGSRAFPDGSRSVGDGLYFLYFHETYHLGQLGLIRRLLGKPGFV